MEIQVNIPMPLQKFTGGRAQVKSSGRNIKELIESLEKGFPGIKESIYDSKDKIRGFINIYVNEEDVKLLNNIETPLKDTDEVSMIAAIAGG